MPDEVRLVNIKLVLILFMDSNNGHFYFSVGRLPSLETIESVMKMSPMIVQGIWDNKSPLLQLPHVTEDMQKFFMSKKRYLKTVQQFCQLKADDRRDIFRTLTDDQYKDILRVCNTMPLIDFQVRTEGRSVTSKWNFLIQVIISNLYFHSAG